MSDDKTVIQARGKRDMLWAIVMLVIAISGVYEYQQITTPLDEAVIFLSPTATVATEPEQAPEVQAPQPKAEAHPEALKEFFNYMDEVNDKANQLVSYEGNALSHIKGAPEVAKTVTTDPHIFEDGKIEIYDSEKGVVDVVDTKAPRDDAKLKQDVAEEQAKEDNTTEETASVDEQEKREAIAQQQVQQQVEKDLQKVAETGGEAPVVLLPGIGVPAVTEEENKAEETIDLTETADDVTTDMEKINRAMQQVEQLNIEGLVPAAETTVSTESAKLPRTDAEVRILDDNGADGGVINMLNQITH